MICFSSFVLLTFPINIVTKYPSLFFGGVYYQDQSICVRFDPSDTLPQQPVLLQHQDLQTSTNASFRKRYDCHDYFRVSCLSTAFGYVQLLQ